MKPFRPLLACADGPQTNEEYFSKMKFPKLASPKLDGIRCIIRDQQAVSRTCKPFRNYMVQDAFTSVDWLDGELIVGLPTDELVYNKTQSVVMSFDKEDELHYHVFDYTQRTWAEKPFIERYEKAMMLIDGVPNYHPVVHELLESVDDVLEYEAKYLGLGYEGIMLRDPFGRYKQGRSTYNEGILYKLKRFEDTEGVLVDLEEVLINQNELETDERGYAKRSSALGNLVPGGSVGTFIVMWNGEPLTIGPGKFTKVQLEKIWNEPDKYLGKMIKFKYFAYGVKDKPRQPIALGFRDEIDV